MKWEKQSLVTNPKDQLVFPTLQPVLKESGLLDKQDFQIRKGLYVRAHGSRRRKYLVIKTTKVKAYLQAEDSGKVFITDRRSLFTRAVPLGHSL